MGKIYCKNCRFYKEYCDDMCGKTWCSHPICYKYKDEQESRKKVRVNDYDRLNKNNNCFYYERKWWKFWIKEKSNKNFESKKELVIQTEEQKKEQEKKLQIKRENDLKKLLAIKGDFDVRYSRSSS